MLSPLSLEPNDHGEFTVVTQVLVILCLHRRHSYQLRNDDEFTAVTSPLS